MKYKNILTKQYLKRKYSIEELSTLKIANIVGCSDETIRRYLKKYNIYIRNYSEAQKGERAYWYGKHFSEGTRQKLSKVMRGKNNPMYGKHRYGKKAPHWKGGRKKDRGYIFIYLPNHPHANGIGYVREHRLIVEKYLGRYLLPTEHIHHINEIKCDNRPENLMVFTSKSSHHRFHKNSNNVKPEEIIFDGRKLVIGVINNV